MQDIFKKIRSWLGLSDSREKNPFIESTVPSRTKNVTTFNNYLESFPTFDKQKKIDNSPLRDSILDLVKDTSVGAGLINNNYKQLYRGRSKGLLLTYKDGTYSSMIKNEKGIITKHKGFTPATLAKAKALTFMLASEITGHAHMYEVKKQLNDLSNKIDRLYNNEQHKSEAYLNTASKRLLELETKTNYIPEDINELRSLLRKLQSLKLESQLNFNSAVQNLKENKLLNIRKRTKKILKPFQFVGTKAQNTGSKVREMEKEIDKSDIFRQAKLAIYAEQFEHLTAILEIKVLEYLGRKNIDHYQRFSEDLDKLLEKEGLNTVALDICSGLEKIEQKLVKKGLELNKDAIVKRTSDSIEELKNNYTTEYNSISDAAQKTNNITNQIEALKERSNQEFQLYIDTGGSEPEVYLEKKI